MAQKPSSRCLNRWHSPKPTLLAIREKSGLFADDEQVLVNYRVQSNRLPDKVILVAGVGSDQDKIIIEREQ
jgi:type IV secretion system protein VirB9